uniref:Dolichyl-diphosphooligosaccharide--protein glycosyltransferase 48 kDa subunit n=1 Tax=Peronospora matthiolae TaxID=2874970 RepID=A0AAV1VDI2_9STRA
MTWRSLLSGVCVTLTVVATQAARTAVVLESPELQKTHSKFFKLLEDRGHQLDFFTGEEQEKEQPLELERYGERTYDNLVLFTPQKALGTLRKSDLLHFVEEGGNVLLSSSKKLTKVQRDFALECGIEFEKRGNVVLDHVNPIPDDGDIYNSVIAAEDFVASERVVGSLASKPKPVAFSGIGMSLEPNNVLAFHALIAPASAYSANPVKPITDAVVTNDLLFGNQIGLVAAVQGRNNARLVFAGSLDLFSDKFFDNEMFSNAEFADAVTKWAFQESGVLRMTNVKHHREDGSLPAKMLSDAHRGDQPITLYPDAEVARDSLVYRVKDNLTYSFDLHELKDGKWVPYRANDVQLEFVMLDPHVRTTMVHDNKGHFHVTFQAPDVYGIFLFRVLYRRLGLSTVYTTTQVSLRPFKHDEYERFIPAAYPYYASAFSMMAGVFLFSVYFLFHEGKK